MSLYEGTGWHDKALGTCKKAMPSGWRIETYLLVRYRKAVRYLRQ